MRLTYREAAVTVIKPALHHVTMKTNQLPAMIAWYSAVIGAQVQFQDANNAWMTNDAANHRIAFLSMPALESDPEKVKHTGMHHSAFEYDSFDDLMASYERLKSEGIVPAFCLEHGLTISIYYKDPDGNHVELQSDNFGDWAKSSEWMRTSPAFAANPIGYFFDAERACQDFKSGKPFKQLQAEIRDNRYAPQRMPDIGLPV
jgi:catechol 2,3-dioxygenase